MDSTRVRSLMQELKTFLEPFEEEHDVKVSWGRITYNDSNLTTKLEIAELSDNGEAMNRAVTDFKQLASSYGLSPEDLNKEFTTPNGTFKITGLNPRKHKYPVMAENRNGKRYKFPAEQVKMYLGKIKKRPKEEILKELRDVESNLEPENLWCDGEASASHVQQMSAMLNRQKRQLIAELGYTPTDKELHGTNNS